MKVGVFYSTAALNGVKILDSFCQGIKTCGDDVKELTNLNLDIDVVVIWSLVWNKNRKHIYDYYRSFNIPVIIIEVGGIIRNKSWRVGLNYIDNRGVPFEYENRWNLFNIDLKPYKKGKKIYITGQNENSELWPKNLTTSDWVNDLYEKIKKVHKNQIIFRPHPRYKPTLNLNKNIKIEKPTFTGDYDQFDLSKKFNDMLLLCNYNSNPAIEATINGVFVHVNQNSLCYDISIQDFNKLNTITDVDRTNWCKFISKTEWFEEELKNGLPYKLLRDYIR